MVSTLFKAAKVLVIKWFISQNVGNVKLFVNNDLAKLFLRSILCDLLYNNDYFVKSTTDLLLTKLKK